MTIYCIYSQKRMGIDIVIVNKCGRVEMLFILIKRENMLKKRFWVKVSVGYGENFLVICIIWSASYQLAVEGGSVGHIEAISNLS